MKVFLPLLGLVTPWIFTKYVQPIFESFVELIVLLSQLKFYLALSNTTSSHRIWWVSLRLDHWVFLHSYLDAKQYMIYQHMCLSILSIRAAHGTKYWPLVILALSFPEKLFQFRSDIFQDLMSHRPITIKALPDFSMAIIGIIYNIIIIITLFTKQESNFPNESKYYSNKKNFDTKQLRIKIRLVG